MMHRTDLPTVHAGSVDVFDGPAPLEELAALPADRHRGDVPMGTFTEREWEIFRQGQRWGYESRQPEVDALQNAYQAADWDADRYYRAAFDHDYHDCAIHENKGRYKGARTRLLHWEYWGTSADDDSDVADAVSDPELEQARQQRPGT